MSVSPLSFSWPKIGQDRAINFLDRSLKASRLSQAYVFAGPEGVGKYTIACHFAKNLLGVEEDKLLSHPDFYVLERLEDKKSISIDQVRNIISRLEMGSFLNSYKIAIIREAEYLNVSAGNALLKVLEEPRDKVLWLILTSSPGALLGTISSRAQVLNFQLLSADFIQDYLKDNFSLSPSRSKNIAHLSLGRLAKAKQYFADEDFYEKELYLASFFLDSFDSPSSGRQKEIADLLGEKFSPYQILETVESALRDLLLLQLGHPDKIRYEVLRERLNSLKERYSFNYLGDLFNSVALARKYLSANVSPKNVLENLAFSF